KVRFKLTVVASDGHASFFRDLTLPFAPYPGLWVAFSDSDPEVSEVKAVHWLDGLKRFDCHLDPETRTDYSLQDCIGFQCQLGWALDRLHRCSTHAYRSG